MRKIMIFMIVSLFAITSFAQKTENDTIVIQTSAKCGKCKARLERELMFEKGVISVSLDNTTKKLSVVYKADKTNPEKIKLAVTKIGYDADEIAANQKAHDRLPKCCQKSADPH